MNIHPKTGATVDDFEEYSLRFKDAVTTPLNHRVKLPSYGCKLYQLQGLPVSDSYISRAAAYIAECYEEPVCNLKQAELVEVKVGRHSTGFQIQIVVEFNGIIKDINI